MINLLSILFFTVITVIASPAHQAQLSDQIIENDSAKKLSIVLFGGDEIAVNNNVIEVADLDDLLLANKITSDFIAHLNLTQNIRMDDVFDVTEILRESSITRIHFNDKFRALRLEIIEDGQIIINHRKISLSALNSHLAAMNKAEETKVYVTTENDISFGDVAFTLKLLGKHNFGQINLQ